MALYNDVLKVVEDLEADVLNDTVKYQLRISQEFSLLERLTGHLFNVCPYNFPAPNPGTVVDLRAFFNPIRSQGNRRGLH